MGSLLSKEFHRAHEMEDLKQNLHDLPNHIAGGYLFGYMEQCSIPQPREIIWEVYPDHI